MNINEAKNKYEAIIGGYSFVVPTTADEIKAEGKAMFNALQCGAYNNQHFNGERILVFAQKNNVDEKGHSLNIDICIEDEAIIHAVGWANRRISNIEREVLDEYAAEKQLAPFESNKFM